MSVPRFARFTLIVVLAVAVALLVAPAAFAASGAASSTAQPKPQVASGPPVTTDAGGPLFVQLWPAEENGMTAALVAIEVPDSTKLPAIVRIPVMPGTTVQWAGEILGGDPNQDPERAYTLKNGIGGTFVEFTLTKSHRAQVDSLGLPLAVKGATTSLNATWVQTVNSPKTTITVRIPAGAFQVKIKPDPAGDPTANSNGQSLYTLNANSFKIGQKQNIAVSYSSEPPSGLGLSMMPLLIGLGSALVVAVIVLFVVVGRQRDTGAGTDEELFEDDREGSADLEAPRDDGADIHAGAGSDHGEAADDNEDDTDLSWD